MPKSQEPQFHAVADIISRIDECFSDMEAIRNDLRDIQYELSDLDKKLHTIGVQVKDLQGVLLQCYPHPYLKRRSRGKSSSCEQYPAPPPETGIGRYKNWPDYTELKWDFRSDSHAG